MLLRCLFKKHLNFTFQNAHKGVFVRVMERPGEWLEDQELEKVVNDLRSVVRESVPAGSLEYGVLSGNRQTLARSVITIIYDNKTNRPLAFNALAYMPCKLRGHNVDVLHLGLVVVSPTCREGGFSWILYGLTSMLLFVRSRFRPIWVSNVTQVPAIIGKVTETFAAIYPSPHKDADKSIDHLFLARQIMSQHRSVFGVGPDAGFDEERFVITNAYTGGSDHLKKRFDQAQPHRDDKYNDFCKTNLDYSRGDDFLQLGRLSLDSCHKYLLRSVPRRSLMGLSVGLIGLSLQGLLLPLLHWFDGRHQQGQVRPWA